MPVTALGGKNKYYTIITFHTLVITLHIIFGLIIYYIWGCNIVARTARALQADQSGL